MSHRPAPAPSSSAGDLLEFVGCSFTNRGVRIFVRTHGFPQDGTGARYTYIDVSFIDTDAGDEQEEIIVRNEETGQQWSLGWRG